MLPKEMAEVAASLRSLVKVWVASEREIVVKLGGGARRAVGINISKVFVPASFIVVK